MNLAAQRWISLSARGKISRRDVNQHSGGKDKIEEAIGIRNLKRRRQRELCVLQPGPRLAQGVVLDFDSVEILESHFPQRTQLVALVAAHFEDARVARYVRQETLVEFAPARRRSSCDKARRELPASANCGPCTHARNRSANVPAGLSSFSAAFALNSHRGNGI